MTVSDGRLERLAVEAGNVTSAVVRPDGALWYRIDQSCRSPHVRVLAGRESTVLMEAPGEPAPVGTSYVDYDAGPIHSLLAIPPGPGPHPTIFLAHGGPEAQDLDTFSPAVQAWVDHGFMVVLTNYRGSTGYGKDWQHAIVGRPGFKELDDLAAVHDSLVSDALADPDRTVLAGHSWGGYLTLLGLGTQPQRWSLGISVVPMADLVKNYHDETEMLRQYDRSLWGGSPGERPGVWQETSPMSYIDALRVPVLIVAGRNDPRSPIGQILSYTAALDMAAKRYETYLYDAGHGTRVTDDAIANTAAEIEFASRHLGTPTPL